MQGGGEGFRGVSHSPVEGECVIMAVGIDERQHLIAKVKVEVAEHCGMPVALVCAIGSSGTGVGFHAYSLSA